MAATAVSKLAAELFELVDQSRDDLRLAMAFAESLSGVLESHLESESSRLAQPWWFRSTRRNELDCRDSGFRRSPSPLRMSSWRPQRLLRRYRYRWSNQVPDMRSRSTFPPFFCSSHRTCQFPSSASATRTRPPCHQLLLPSHNLVRH